MKARLSLALFAMVIAACGGDDPPPGPDAPWDDADASVPDAEVAPPDAAVESECNDGTDNDADGDIDCADGDCTGAPNCVPEDDCMDAVDNDLDGNTDCDDTDCAAEINCIPETECMDAADNDLDTLVDCDDDDCADAPNCNPETNCENGTDDDLDGAIDCDDSDCTVSCLIGCPVGTTGVQYTVTGPIAFGATNASATLSVAESATVVMAAAEFDAIHAWDADVDLFVNSPAMTRVELTSLNGGSGDNFTGTLFIDSAATAIADGLPPFTGEYRPNEPLSAFAGQGSAGDWLIEFNDNFPTADNGTVNSFDLYLCLCVDCEAGGAQCTDGLDNNADGLTDCDDPTCGGVVNCIPEVDCNNGIDDDFDGLVDCADGDCDTRDACEFGTEENCADGFDNDADGVVDCLDMDCDEVGTCEFGVEDTCDDDLDNDVDGLTDCADATDCGITVYCSAESNCLDGIDNDMDGAMDCADFGCAGALGCEPAGEVSCSDGFDNDSDGAIDCADPNCAGGFNCSVTCPAGSTATYLVSTDVPLAFGMTPSFVSSEVNHSSVGVVTQVAIQFDITHPYVADADVRLRSPAGTLRDGSILNGGSGDNYVDTTLIDSATCTIGSGTCNTPPFTGQFRPEQAFSAFNGQPAQGNWALEVTDNFPTADNGTLTDFRIVVCSCNGTAGCEFGAACSDGLDNDGDSIIDCLDSDCSSAPACVPPETNCSDGVDNDFDGLTDCADTTCAGLAGCESEANNTLATADSFETHAVNGRVRAAIGAVGDVDYFSFTVPAGVNQAVWVNTFGGSTGNDVVCTSSDTNLSVRNASDVTVTNGSNNDMDTFVTPILRCSHVPLVLAPGTYYARVVGVSGTFSYQLGIRMEPVPVGTPETEPNDDGATATGGGTTGNDFAIANAGGPYSVDSIVTAAITPAGDEDVFAIANIGVTPQLVYIETFNTTFGTCTMDTVMHIRDASGASLAYDDESGAGSCSFIAYNLAAGATVYAHVLDYLDDSSVTSYGLFVSTP